MSEGTLWVESYRPKTFDEIVGNNEIIEEVESQVKSGNMNHMAFFGPPGVGKTTTALVAATELYGSHNTQHFMELNASDERGIDTIRHKVKKFAGRKTLTGSHKLIFLDEGDQLTKSAQQALRRIMENYQESCRFIISGNEEGGVIDAIKSRCSGSVYSFKPIDDESAKGRLIHIVKEESASVDPEDIDKIVTIYSGDLRSMVGKLQAIAYGDGSILEAGEDYLKVLKLIKDGNFPAAKRVATDENLKRMYRYVMSKDSIPAKMKADISIVVAKYQWRMSGAPDQDIQRNAMIAELIEIVENYV